MQGNLYNTIKSELAKDGINTISDEMRAHIMAWKEWYQGNVASFHMYSLMTVGGTMKPKERLTMNMAKKLCEDLSKLVWTEACEIVLDGNSRTDDGDNTTKELWNILTSRVNNFAVNFPELLEKMFALGTAAMVQYISDDEVMIDYIDGDLIIPTECNNSHISGLVTVSRKTEMEHKKAVYLTHLTIHSFTRGRYTKTNRLYKSNDDSSLGKLQSWEEKYPDIAETVEILTEAPHFQVLRPNIANNYVLDSPLGISVFANHVDKLKAIDTKYDSFAREFVLGRKRVMIDRTAVKAAAQPRTTKDKDGNEVIRVEHVQYFDTNDEAYVAISGMENQPLKEIDFSLRADEHIKAINAELNYLSAGAGLGQDFYSFDGSAATKTATEVISEKSDTFRSKVHHEIVIRDALLDMVAAVCELSGIPYGEITIRFDDSIIQNKEAVIKQALLEYNAGIIDVVEYLIRTGMTEEEATMLVDKMRARAGTESEPMPE